MPTVFETRFDGSNAIRYFHVPIANFYLNSSLSYAQKAQEFSQDDEQLRRIICAITFSAMTLEAFINERSDDVIPSADKNTFDRTQKPYKKSKGQSSVAYKYQCLVKLKYELETPPDILNGIEDLIATRNMLVHYKPIDTAGKYIMPPPAKTPISDGNMMLTIDFMQKPVRIEPPFLQKLTASTAAEAYNSVIRALRYWHELSGDSCGLDTYPVVSPNPSIKADATT